MARHFYQIKPEIAMEATGARAACSGERVVEWMKRLVLDDRFCLFAQWGSSPAWQWLETSIEFASWRECYNFVLSSEYGSRAQQS